MNRQINYPLIPRFYEVYEDDSKVYLIFEYLKGGDLCSLFMKKKISLSKIAVIISKLLQILVYLERNKILHRDIKLENILLSSNADNTSIKLADFGLGERYDLLQKYNACGTPGYSAPELIQSKSYDYKVDLFSTGVVLYTL